MHIRLYSFLPLIQTATLLVLIAMVLPQFLCAQPASNASAKKTEETSTKARNWRVERQSIERSFADELQDIALWCRQNGHPELSEKTFAWHQNRDLSRQYIFIAPIKGMPAPKSDDETIREWETKIVKARRQHAVRVYKLAAAAADSGAGASAFQLLHEVLFYDPDHEPVRKILGHRAEKEGGWQVSPDRLKMKKATRQHSVLNWKPKTYFSVTTPHFEIASKANEKATLQLAYHLERWHDVWRQVFFEFWNKPSSVKRWIEGKGKAPSSTKKFRIVLFANEQEYISELESMFKGIAGSKGYYHDSTKTAFVFNSSEDAIKNTWRHEATHQWFQESIRSTEAPFSENYLWLGEGIAMYFESLTDFGSYVTLGGFDSRRVQYARVRSLRENFYIPMNQLTDLSQTEFQTHPDRGRLYSQSAGITHMLMDDNEGAHQQKLISFLKLLYRGKLKPDAFEKVLNSSGEELDHRYRDFLAVSSEQLETKLSRPETRTELALPDAALTRSAFKVLGKCTNLDWLDITSSHVTAGKLEALASCKRLSQLFLTKCKIDGDSLAKLAQFPLLEELDLSGSSVTNSQLAQLANCPKLSILRLVNTSVSDECAQYVSKINSLTELDLTGSQVSATGIANLQAANPNLKISSN